MNVKGVYDAGRGRLRPRDEAVHERRGAEGVVREADDHDALRAAHLVQGGARYLLSKVAVSLSHRSKWSGPWLRECHLIMYVSVL